MQTEKLILGIDPGTNLMGYGIIKVTGKQKVEVIVSGVVNMKKLDNQYLKLQTIFKKTIQIIDQYKPDELAIESQFFGNNIQSMLKLGRAQGVAIAAALERDMPIFEYAPRKIKMSITGTGTASKEQMAILLQNFLKIKSTPRSFDETDALAIAYCHFLQSNSIQSKSKSKSWSDYIKQNPDKIK